MKTTSSQPGVVGLIGNTPLIRLSFASEETGCEIFAKAELDNPASHQGHRDVTAPELWAQIDGRLEASTGSSIAEGIGQLRLTGNLAAARIDTAFRIEDHESLSLVWRLLAEEGLAIGHSSAVNVAGAIQLAKRLGPGHRIATVLCDGLGRYESKLGDVARLQSLGLPPPLWLLEGARA